MLSPRFAKHLLQDAYRNGQRFHIYLSGPMTGLPDYNRPAFAEVAEELRSQGKSVFNPGDIGPTENIMPRAWYMRKDLEALMKSDSVYLLPGWENSPGAQLEVEIARELELPIVQLNHPSTKSKKGVQSEHD
jgi:glycosyltransferase involved in cell wall biosynthesis